MATRFVGDSKIDTRVAPFWSVRRDSAATNPKLREQMRQLVPKGPIDLVANYGRVPRIPARARKT